VTSGQIMTSVHKSNEIIFFEEIHKSEQTKDGVIGFVNSYRVYSYMSIIGNKGLTSFTVNGEQ
jgi:hypothetical protein